MKKEHYRLALKAKAELLEEIANGEKNPHDTACALVFGEKGTITSRSGVCHSFLGVNSGKPLGVINHLQYEYAESHGPGKWEETSDDDKIMFLDWLMNRSPYQTAFVSKSAKRVLRDKCAVITAEVAGNLVGAACVSMRRLWEHNFILMVWRDLVKAGVNENLAYILGHMADGERTCDGSLNWSHKGGWHAAISIPGITSGTVKNFVEGNMVGLTDLYSITGNYNGYSGKLFDRGGQGIDFIHKQFPYIKNTKNTNVFSKVDGDERSGSYDDVIKQMVEFQYTIFKECNINLEKINA